MPLTGPGGDTRVGARAEEPLGWVLSGQSSFREG